MSNIDLKRGILKFRIITEKKKLNEFEVAVTKAVRNFSIGNDNFSPYLYNFFQECVSQGTRVALCKYADGLLGNVLSYRENKSYEKTHLVNQNNLTQAGNEINSINNFNQAYSEIYRRTFICLAQAIFDALPTPVKAKYLPKYDFDLVPSDKEEGEFIKIQFSNLIETSTNKGKPKYQSIHKPTVRVNGRNYHVAFQKHALDQMVKEKGRFLPSSALDNYELYGDIHGIIQDWVNFELRYFQEGDRPYIEVFEFCSNPGTIQHIIAKSILGRNPKIGEFLKVGYMSTDQYDDILLVTTFLRQTMNRTPENNLRKALIGRGIEGVPSKKRSSRDSLFKMEDNQFRYDSADLDPLIWCHHNGEPQVREFEISPFKNQSQRRT